MKLLLTFSLLSIIALVSCKKPKELPYEKLEYESKGVTGILKDPETKQGFTGVSQSRDEKGRLVAEFPVKNGLFHGTVKEWYPNGKKKSETEFKNGERFGKNIEWTEAGLIYSERVYERDVILSEKKHEAGK
jgi:antitoxin component YwqK of YwqJK toxin-antitoxin module